MKAVQAGKLATREQFEEAEATKEPGGKRAGSGRRKATDAVPVESSLPGKPDMGGNRSDYLAGRIKAKAAKGRSVVSQGITNSAQPAPCASADRAKICPTRERARRNPAAGSPHGLCHFVSQRKVTDIIGQRGLEPVLV